MRSHNRYSPNDALLLSLTGLHVIR